MLYGGVSRQAPSIRHPNQVEDAENAIFTVTDGLAKRPGSHMEFAVSGLTAEGNHRVHAITRDSTERYIVIYGRGASDMEVRVYDLDGNAIPVTISAAAQAYLNSGSATADNLKLVTVADHTIILNTLVETDSEESATYSVTDRYDNYDLMASTLGTAGGYYYAKEDTTSHLAGHYKYVLSAADNGFAYWTSGLVGTDWDDPTDYWNDGVHNPMGFKVTFTDPSGVDHTYEVEEDFDTSEAADMYEVAQRLQDSLQDAGAHNALISWVPSTSTNGRFVIVSPYRGAGSAVKSTAAPTSNYDLTHDATKPFYFADGTATAGAGTPDTDTVDIADRWEMVAAPAQPTATLTANTMPVKMVREEFGAGADYADMIKEDSPVSFWRLGEAGTLATGDGLTGKYYNNANLTNLKLTRIDSKIDFYWGSDAPIAGMGTDYFSVRWTGEILPEFSETYTFKTHTNDGVRLWVNDVLLIDDWGVSTGWRDNTGTIALTAGTRYSIKMEYYEAYSRAGARLYWSSASQAEEIIPKARLFHSPDEAATASDEMGVNDGSYEGTPTMLVEGAITNDSNTAVTFDGAADYVNAGDLGTFGYDVINGFSLECWFKTASDTEQDIMGCLNNGESSIYTGLYLKINDGQLEFYLREDDVTETAIKVQSDLDTYDDGEWHHLVVTCSAARAVVMYVDGAAVDTTTVTDDSPIDFTAFSEDFYIGASNLGGTGAQNFFVGTLDEVAIYGVRLQASQVLQHYNLGQGTQTRSFNIDVIDWSDRTTGNQDSNPVISIVEGQDAIQDFTFHRNRLTIAGDENIVFSQSGDFFNFFMEDANNIGDADPIDTALSSNEVTVVDYIVPFRKSLIIFTKAARQFELNAPETLTPNTVAITPTTAYKSMAGIRPAVSGNFLYFPAADEGASTLMEYYYSDSEATNTAADVSAHVRGYLPSSIRTIQAVPNANVIAVLPTDDNDIYIYRSFWQGEEKAQSAWCKWTLDSTETICDMAAIDSDLWLLVEGAAGFYVLSLSVNQEQTVSGWDYPIHLDNQVTSTGSYSSGTGKTTWTLAIPDSTKDKAVLGPAFTTTHGTVISLTKVNSTHVTATGNYSAGSVVLGRAYTMDVTLSRPYTRDAEGRAIIDTEIQIAKLVTNHVNSGEYVVRVVQPGRTTRDSTWTPRDGDLTESEGRHQVLVMGNAKDTTISIRNTSALPSIIPTAEYVANVTHRSQ